MDSIKSKIDTKSSDFQSNLEFNQQIVNDLNERLNRVRQGGGEKSVARHRSREKLLS